MARSELGGVGIRYPMSKVEPNSSGVQTATVLIPLVSRQVSDGGRKVERYGSIVYDLLVLCVETSLRGWYEFLSL